MDKYIIYDDNRSDAEELKRILNKIQPEITVDIACSKQTASELIKINSYTVFFMDIELDDNNNGIFLVDSMQRRGYDFSIVYITAHIKYCEDIFTTKTDALLTKPFSEERLKNVIDIIEKKNRKSFFIVKTKRNETMKINHNDIMIIEHAKRILNIYDTKENLIYSLYDGKISDFISELPYYFARCHQSFVVNMNYIKSIQKSEIILNNGREIPVSFRYGKTVHDNYMEFLKNII